MGTALATGSEQSCFGTPAATLGQLAWAAWPKAQLSVGTEGHAQGRTCFPGRRKAADGADSWSLKPCSFGSKNDPTEPWSDSLPSTQVLTVDRHNCTTHTGPAQWSPAVLQLRRKGCFVDLRAWNLARAAEDDRHWPSPHVGAAPGQLDTFPLGQGLLWAQEVSAI